MTFDPLARREELRAEAIRVAEQHHQASERRDLLKLQEDPQSPPGDLPRPQKTRKLLAQARIDAARTGDHSEVERLESREAEIEREVADLLDTQRQASAAQKAIEQDVADLCRAHFDAFAEVAEAKVAAFERAADDLWPHLAAYVDAWEEAVEAWAEPCRHYGIAGAPACPLPPPDRVRGIAPRPEQVEVDVSERGPT